SRFRSSSRRVGAGASRLDDPGCRNRLRAPPRSGPPVARSARNRRWTLDVVNGRRSDLRGYSEHLGRSMPEYARFRISGLDEPIAADDRVVTSYALEGEKRNGEKEEMAVMAIWRLEDGKVKSLHEVDAPVEG